MLGLLLMRVAAYWIIRLLERFPRFEISAYLLVAVIGCKLLIDWAAYYSEAWRQRIDFQSVSSGAFWVLWLTMLACLLIGFLPKRHAAAAPK